MSEKEIISLHVLPYLQRLGYSKFETESLVGHGRIGYVDVVAYLGENRERPFVVVEVKRNLRSEVTLLDPAVQQAFAYAAALGPNARYLLITDGTHFHWFERNAESQSLEKITYPPKAESARRRLAPNVLQMQTLDSEKFAYLLQSILNVLRKNGASFSVKMGIELNRILIAKLYDEQSILNGGERQFRSDISLAELPEVIDRLSGESGRQLNSPQTRTQTISLPQSAYFEIVSLLEHYSLLSVSPAVRGRVFWRTFGSLLMKGEGQFVTPPPLAEFVVHLARPLNNEKVIDPACGTGLLLLEAQSYMDAQLAGTLFAQAENSNTFELQSNQLTGIELNTDVAVLAHTNFVLNGLSPQNVINTDALEIKDLERLGVSIGSYDVVLLNPPIGPVDRERLKHEWFELGYVNSKPTLESLFLELSLRLLRPGGRAAIVLPDSFLSLPNMIQVRQWLLDNFTIRAVISLPATAFSMVGHAGKASVLLLEKGVAKSPSVLVADVKNVGYDRFGQKVKENDLPHVVDAIDEFQRTDDITAQEFENGLRIWPVAITNILAERFDIASLDPSKQDNIRALKLGKYPTVQLGEVAEVLSGRNFKNYVEDNPEAPILIQAGAVRDLQINFESVPHIPKEAYDSANRSRVELNDVLVTSTGQYLGRAAVVSSLPAPAVASSAVTIVRPWSELDAEFLAALLNSPICREQIVQLQANATAQPYIRRADVAKILIPLPPLEVQRKLASDISKMLAEAKELAQMAEALESRARKLVVSALLEDQRDG